MKRFFKIAVASLALGGMLGGAMPAQAGEWRHGGYHGGGYGHHGGYKGRHGYRDQHRYWRHHGKHRKHREYRDDDDDALAAGIAGLAAGAILGGLLTQSQNDYGERVYIDPPVPASGYSAPAGAWTDAWYRDCARRYRSFDPRSGTFLGYDGERHFCQPR